MKITAFLIGILLTFSALAQMPGMNRGGQQLSGRFYGKVVDAAHKGIDAASVILVQDKLDSATKQRKELVIGGMLTKPNGEFSIENVPVMGRYKLRITGIGYKSYEQLVAFERPNRSANADPSAMLSALDKDLGNIELTIDDKLLSGVTVTASKPLLQMGIDRKIFNVEKNITSAGGTAVDVMKNVPSVSVDIDGNVTLRNNAPQIFVDGRPTTLTMEQIPADAIESVEIITNPSAKYDASGGTAGILNIVLKKQKRVGYAGSLRTSIDSRARLGLGGDINVRQDKINFFASTHLSQRKSLSEGQTDRVSFGPKTITSRQTDDNTMEGAFGFGRAGFDYFINNRNTVTVSGMLMRGKMSPETESAIYLREQSASGDTTYNNKRFTNSTNNFRNAGGQLSFKHIFPKPGNEWTADVNYYKGSNDNLSNIRNNNYRTAPNAESLGTYTQNQVGSGENENLVIQTDYVNPIKENSKVELGARASIRKMDNMTTYDIAGKVSSTLYSNEDRVYAAYANFSNRIKNFGYQVGLRAENSLNEGILNTKQPYKKEFPISLFPSIFLSQKLGEMDDLQLNYSRRINRPNFFQLFPFTDYSDSFNITKGNPDLNPEFTNSLELSYSKTFKNRDNFIASVYFKNTNNLITRYFYEQFDTLLNKDILVNTYINANRSYVTGLELTSRNNITKFWDVTSNANFFTSKIDLENEPDPDQFLSYFLKLNNNFKLPKNFTLQISADYTSKIISSPGGSGGGGGRGGYGGGMGGGMWGGSASAAQGYIRPNYGVDAAIRYDFLKNRTASLSLNVNDIFRTKLYDAHSESPLFVQDAERRRDPQVFRLNFNWRFGKFDASLFKRKNNRSENDTQMEGMGM